MHGPSHERYGKGGGNSGGALYKHREQQCPEKRVAENQQFPAIDLVRLRPHDINQTAQTDNDCAAEQSNHRLPFLIPDRQAFEDIDQPIFADQWIERIECTAYALWSKSVEYGQSGYGGDGEAADPHGHIGREKPDRRQNDCGSSGAGP